MHGICKLDVFIERLIPEHFGTRVESDVLTKNAGLIFFKVLFNCFAWLHLTLAWKRGCVSVGESSSSLVTIEVDLPKAVNACINHSWAYNGFVSISHVKRVQLHLFVEARPQITALSIEKRPEFSRWDFDP